MEIVGFLLLTSCLATIPAAIFIEGAPTLMTQDYCKKHRAVQLSISCGGLVRYIIQLSFRFISLFGSFMFLGPGYL